jgi:uracil-DNA glycosylase
MVDRPSESLAWIPANADLDALVDRARECRACGLYARATHVVFGEGPAPAPMMLVGEQPGDREDVTGRPFVGPAGRLLDDALAAAEIPRDQVYVTNAVKHFKWEPRGKRRLHSKPNAVEIHACRGWLEAEVALVKPKVIVCLGATAAKVMLGRDFKITEQRGVLLDGHGWGERLLATFHPSAILRMRSDEDEYVRAKRSFILDLAEAASAVTFRRGRRIRPRPNVAP